MEVVAVTRWAIQIEKGPEWGMGPIESRECIDKTISLISRKIWFMLLLFGLLCLM